MQKKTVFYVEDYPAQRKSLHLALEWAGFEVESVGTVAEARALLDEKDATGEYFDVMLLDMKLDRDPDSEGVTGAQLTIEYLKEKKPVWRPEFLILSAFKELEYFEHALQLGVAAYLYKGDVYKEASGNEEVVQHVRVLALRRALSVERPEIAKDIGDIVSTSTSCFDALTRFCKKRLIPELRLCLGMPFFLLLKDNEGMLNDIGHNTLYCGGDYRWPEYDEVYDRLQALAHANANDTIPVVIEKNNLPEPKCRIQLDMLERLDGCVVLPIVVTNDVRLAIGLTQGGESSLLDENPQNLVKILAQYFRSQSIAVLLELLIQVKEMIQIRERIAEQKARLKETAHICLYFGQEQQKRLEEVEAAASKSEPVAAFLRANKSFRGAKSLAEEAYATGNILKGLSELAAPQHSENQAGEPMAVLIQDAWSELEVQRIAEDIEFEVKGDCLVQAKEEDLWLVVVRLLQWLAQRQKDTPEEVKPTIQVHCRQTDEVAEILIEDRSRRLPLALRKRLFAPMTLATPSLSDKDSRLVVDSLNNRRSVEGLGRRAQSLDESALGLEQKEGGRLKGPGLYLALYLAKMLIEAKYGGKLLDCSDEIEDGLGHRFLISLPAVIAQTQVPSSI